MGLFDRFKKEPPLNKEEKAIQVITQMLRAFHAKEYEKAMTYVDESEENDLTELFERVDATLADNGFDRIDEYGTPCNFHPQYEYSQLSIYEFNDNSGFAADYDMTSHSELVDLTLQLKFIYTNRGLKTVFLGIDPS